MRERPIIQSQQAPTLLPAHLRLIDAMAGRLVDEFLAERERDRAANAAEHGLPNIDEAA